MNTNVKTELSHSERLLLVDNYLNNIEQRTYDPEFNALLRIAKTQFDLNRDLNDLINASLRLLS